MHDLPSLAGFHHQTYLGPGAFPNEVVVDRRGRQQGRNGHLFGIDPAIGENDDVVTLAHRLRHLAAECFQAASNPPSRRVRRNASSRSWR